MAFTKRLADIGKPAKYTYSPLSIDKGGNSGDFLLKTLVLRLVEVSTEITDNKTIREFDPYGNKCWGLFMNFVEAFLGLLGKRY